MTTATLRDLPESAYELGELKHDLRVSQEGFAISVLLLIVMSGLTIYAAWRLWPAAAAAPQLWDQARLAGLPVVLLCVVVFTAANASRFYLRRHTRVLLFEEGLVCFRKQAAFSCRWDEVDEINEVVNYRGEGDLVWHVTLRCGDFCWTFDNHEDPIGSFNVLAETIQEETSRRKLPAALAALLGGQVLDFGGLRVSREGVERHDKLIPWSSINCVRGSPFAVAIEAHGRWSAWCEVPCAELANRRLMLLVIDNVHREVAEAVAPEKSLK